MCTDSHLPLFLISSEMRTTLSFFHLISLACSSFCQSPRSKLSPSPTRSSKPSRRTNLSPTTRTKFSFFQETASFFGLSSVPIHFSLRFAGVGRISWSCSPESTIFGSFSEPHFYVPFEPLAVFCCGSFWNFFFFFLVEWERERSIWILDWSSVPDWWGRGLASVLLVMKKKVTV